MRCVLFLLLTLFAVVDGRRGSAAPVTNPDMMRKRAVLGQWGYPYGWGLDTMPTDESERAKVEPHHDKSKEVKQVVNKKSMPKKCQTKTGWFGKTDLHVSDVEDLLDHCLE